MRRSPRAVLDASPVQRLAVALPIAMVVYVVAFSALRTPLGHAESGKEAVLVELREPATGWKSAVETALAEGERLGVDLVVVAMNNPRPIKQPPKPVGASDPEPNTTWAPQESKATASTARSIKPPVTLVRGDTGVEVARLKELLRLARYDPGTVNGVFDDATHAAVVAFQETRGLSADGVVGERTWQALVAVASATTSWKAAPEETSTTLTTAPPVVYEAPLLPAEVGAVLDDSTIPTAVFAVEGPEQVLDQLRGLKVVDGSGATVADGRSGGVPLAPSLAALALALAVPVAAVALPRRRDQLGAPTNPVPVPEPEPEPEPVPVPEPEPEPALPAPPAVPVPPLPRRRDQLGAPTNPVPVPEPELEPEPALPAPPAGPVPPLPLPEVMLSDPELDGGRLPHELVAATVIRRLGYVAHGRLLLPVHRDGSDGSYIEPGTTVIVRTTPQED